MNACANCKRGKRRCSKSRPSCLSCLRLGKTCLYTEDDAKTHFETEVGTQQWLNGTNSFNHVMTTDFDRRTTHSKSEQIALRVKGVEVAKASTSKLVVHQNRMSVSLIRPIDPIIKLPDGLGEQGLEALDHLYRGSFHPLLAMQNCGLVTRVRENAAFIQLLAFSSWRISILRGETHNSASLQILAKATRELQKQICDPILNKSMDLLMGVLIFASSSAQMGDPETAKVHVEGAQRMMKFQAILRSIESDASARPTLFWVETSACSFADLPPHLPLPTKYLTEFKRSNNQVSDWIETNTVDPTVSPVFTCPAAVRAVNAIREVLIIIRSEAYKRNISQDTYFSSNHMLPILHELLSMLNHERSLLQEGVRLAAMLFIHELQATYWGRIPPPLFLDKLHRLICSSELNWSSHDPTLFWILAIALTSDMATSEHRACFIRKFGILIMVNRITDFATIMSNVSQIFWDYDVLKKRTEELRGCFEEIVTTKWAFS